METDPKTIKGDRKVESIRKQIVFFVSLASVFVGLGVLAACYGYRKVCQEAGGCSLNNLAMYGSYLQGAVASLWSLAGLFLIYVAFLAQREQLILQDAELGDQKKQLAIQHESIKRQNFESSFFQLLSLQHQIVMSLAHGAAQGRDCFNYWHTVFRSDFDQFIRRIKGAQPTVKDLSDLEMVKMFYQEFYKSKEVVLGHYFRNLYHIFKFVKSSDIPDKRRYTSLARAQLSKFELFLLFYNCLDPHGSGFKPLVEEFGLLEHLDQATLLDKSHVKEYSPKAFI